MLVRAS